jgi:hypothetical protein
VTKEQAYAKDVIMRVNFWDVFGRMEVIKLKSVSSKLPGSVSRFCRMPAIRVCGL